MPFEPKDTDSDVIGRDDVSPQFEGDDLEFPSSADDYEKSPTAKHTDFNPESGRQNIDGTSFDVGGLLTKSIPDAVTAIAKAVAAVKKAKEEPKDRDAAVVGRDDAETDPQKKKASSPPPVKTGASNSSGYAVVFGVLGVSILGSALVLRAAARKRRRAF
jgi:hypothetical protein